MERKGEERREERERRDEKRGRGGTLSKEGRPVGGASSMEACISVGETASLGCWGPPRCFLLHRARIARDVILGRHVAE